jgi:hypothetical protein
MQGKHEWDVTTQGKEQIIEMQSEKWVVATQGKQ